MQTMDLIVSREWQQKNVSGAYTILILFLIIVYDIEMHRDSAFVVNVNLVTLISQTRAYVGLERAAVGYFTRRKSIV